MFSRKKKAEPKVIEKVVERIVYVCPSTLSHSRESIRSRLAGVECQRAAIQDDCPHPTIIMGYGSFQTCDDCKLVGQDIRNKTGGLA